MTTSAKMLRKIPQFVEHLFAANLNAAEAMRRLGYPGKNPANAAAQLMMLPETKAAVAAAAAERLEQAGIKIERVLREIADCAYADLRELFNRDGSIKLPHLWDDRLAASIESIDIEGGKITRIRRVKKLEALTLLGRYFALWKDNIDVTGEITHRYVVVAPEQSASTAEWQRSLPSKYGELSRVPSPN